MYEPSNLAFRSPKIFKNNSPSPSNSSRSFKRKGSLLRFANQQKRQEYHPQNNQYPKNSVYYDSTAVMKDQSMHNSIPTNQSQDSWRQYSQKKSLRQSQYSISGFHNQRKKYEQQITVLKKQTSRLQKEIEAKDKQINSIEQNRSQFKQIQMELIQTYRVINYYEGKIKEQQKINTYLENILNTEVEAKTKGKLKQGLDFKNIIQFFRNQSISLKGQLQKSNHQNTKITIQFQKLQSKFNQLEKAHRQLLRSKQTSNKNDYEIDHLESLPQKKKAATIYEARLQSSQNRIAMRRTDDQTSVASSMKSYSSQKKIPLTNTLNQSNTQQKNDFAKIYGNFNSKINKIEKELDFFKIQNEKAQIQLIQKIQIIGELTLENDELKYLLGNKDNQMDYVGKIQNNQTQKQSQNLMNQVVASLPQNFLPMKKISTAESEKKTTHKLGNNFNKVNFRPVDIPGSSDKRKTQLKNLSLNELSKKLHESQQKPYKFRDILPQTLRKLRCNLIRQGITYLKMLQVITQKLTISQSANQIIQELEDIPYQLTNKEALSFLSQFKKIQAYLKEKQLSESIKNVNQPNKDLSKEQNDKKFKEKLKQIFKQNISQFKNITIRKDASLTAQLTKTFKNRLGDIDPYLRDKKKGIISFEQAEKMFKQQWHLSDQQMDFIFLKSCEESQQHLKFDFYKTIQFFLQN